MPKIQNQWEETTCQDHDFSAATQSPVGEVPEFAFSRFANPGPQELARKIAKISPQTRSVSQQRCLCTLVPDLVAAKVNPFGGAAFQSLRQDLRQLPPTCPGGYAEDLSTGCRLQDAFNGNSGSQAPKYHAAKHSFHVENSCSRHLYKYVHWRFEELSQ